MSHPDERQTAQSLNDLARTWLKRELTPGEVEELAAFQQAWHDDAPAAPEAQATASRLRDALRATQHASQQFLEAQQRAEAQILKALEAAQALDALQHAAALQAPAAPARHGTHATLQQIADRLGDLAETDVHHALVQQMNAARPPLEARTASLAVNPQVTDAVTQSNVKVIGEAPAMAMGSIYQTMAHSTGILFQNAVAAQQQQNTLSQAAANQGVKQIYSVDTTAAAAATEQAAQTGVADNLASLLTVLNAFRAK